MPPFERPHRHACGPVSGGPEGRPGEPDIGSVAPPYGSEEVMSVTEHITFVVNGAAHELDVEPRRLLVQALREDLDLTGTHVGCDTSQCGACTVHVDGQADQVVHDARGPGGRRRDRRPSRASPTAMSSTRCRPRSGRSTASSAASARPGMIMVAVDLLTRNPIRPTTRSATRSRATSAAAPATRTSSLAIRHAAETMRSGVAASA